MELHRGQSGVWECGITGYSPGAVKGRWQLGWAALEVMG